MTVSVVHLRACPHCGGQAGLRPRAKQVICQVCGAATRACPSTEQAIEEWNARALLCPNCGCTLDATSETHDNLGRLTIVCRHCKSAITLGGE